MKKIIIIFLLIFLCVSPVFAETTDETMRDQEKELGILEFIDEASKYTKENFEDIDLKEMYKNAVSGETNLKGIANVILKLAGNEIKSTIQTLGYILIIIIIHSVIRNISEGMGNGEISEISYYVQYIMIVTLIMGNFSEIIIVIKDTVNNLVGFLNSLIPILITLMITTGNIVTASTVEPILLMMITIIRKCYFICFFTTYSCSVQH